MKLLILALFLYTLNATPLISNEFHKELKEVADFDIYEPEENPFKDWTVEDIKSKLLGVQEPTERDNYFAQERLHFESNASLPDSFDSRVTFKDCVHSIRNQLQCGSCWAFGASESLSDRVCIASKGAENVVLSPQYQLQCDWLDMGCNGGRMGSAWYFLEHTGLPSDTCVPYTSGGGSCPWTCPSKCADGSAFKLYKVKDTKHYGDVDSIKTAIMNDGPVEGAFTVYQDFMSYKSGVYKHSTGSMLGGHAIKILGWGTESGEDYWLVANSWGPTWGQDGFFKIAQGDCGINDQVYAGTPDVSTAFDLE